MKKDRGFTIVELLIVIVVIAILAAIVIVAYNGVTARANTSKAQTNAVAVQKKAEAYNADNTPSIGGNGVYPASATTATTGWTALTTANPTMLGAIPSGITIGNAAPTSTNGTTYVQYVACATGAANSNTATGYYVGYYNFQTGAVVTISGGSASGGSCPSGTTASTS